MIKKALEIEGTQMCQLQNIIYIQTLKAAETFKMSVVVVMDSKPLIGSPEDPPRLHPLLWFPEHDIPFAIFLNCLTETTYAESDD